MWDYLFSAKGRLNRARFWMAALIYILASIVVVIGVLVLWQVIPGDVTDGSFHIEGVKAVPYIVLTFGYFIFCVWSGICVGIKRFHDRGKSGAWVLIQLVPIIGPLWYFVEAGCLRGTVGPNEYGPDPLGGGFQTMPPAYGQPMDGRRV